MADTGPGRPGDVLNIRHPACGKETEHDPHEFTENYWPDGRVHSVRDRASWCSGWSAAEADLSDLIREVQVTLLARRPPDGSKRFQLEIHPRVVYALQGMFLPPDGLVMVRDLFGAVLAVRADLPPGGWRLVEMPPAVISGTVRGWDG